MSGWSDWIFGNLPPPPTHPASQGALLGMGGYQAMSASPNIDDQRQAADYSWWMKNFYPTDSSYSPSALGAAPSPSATLPGRDPMLDAGPMLAEGATAEDVAPYRLSFPQNRRAQLQAPYQRFEYGPNLPSPSTPSGLPYIGSHLPISPGDRGWTSPASPSGPHNQQGDPARPGYASPELPMDAASFQQVLDAFRAWRGRGQ